MSMFYCKNCDKFHVLPITQCLIVDGELVCPSCAELYAQCQDCGNWFLIDDGYTYQGEPLCQSCYDDSYYTCEDCGEVVYCDDAIYINSEYKTICPSCADNDYYRCDDCGKYFNDDDVHTDDNRCICNDCYCDNGYYTCSDCGEIISSYDVHFDRYDDAYCSSCYDNHRHNDVIYDYGDHPELEFHTTEQDKNNDLYFGFELEIEIDTDYAEDFLSYFNDDEVYLSHDSSVDGFEIVSHPMTWNYLNGDFKNRLERALKFAQSVGAKGHNAGGMHIHISRDGIENKQLRNIEKLIYHKKDTYSYNIVKTISQRRDCNIHWCEWDKTHSNNKDRKITSKDDRNWEKYTAINLKHTDTIEFRLFNSNLRIERVYKNLEFVKALLDFTKQSKKHTFKYFFIWLKEINQRNIYKNLVSFLIEKNLIKSIKNNLIILNNEADADVQLQDVA